MLSFKSKVDFAHRKKKHKSLEPGETIDIPFLILIQDLTNYFLLPGCYGLTF